MEHGSLVGDGRLKSKYVAKHAPRDLEIYPHTHKDLPKAIHVLEIKEGKV